MSLLIKNGEIVTAETRYKADIYVEKDTITQIGKNLEAPKNATVIDAKGKYVFPGFIDPHVHIHLPFMGTYAKDDYASASEGRADRRHDHVDRNVLSVAHRRRDEVVRVVARQGRGAQRMRFHLSHGRGALRQKNRGPAQADRQGRHQQL
jgi:imidazolonepropionase-like amidohydrolase